MGRKVMDKDADDTIQEPGQKEHHEPQFRGCWCPPDLFELLASEEINHTEFVLALAIDRLVKHGGRACFASNRYLAAQIHIPRVKISAYITHLEEVGILTRWTHNHQRLLRTVWGDWRELKSIGAIEPGEGEGCHLKVKGVSPKGEGGCHLKVTRRIRSLEYGLNIIPASGARGGERGIPDVENGQPNTDHVTAITSPKGNTITSLTLNTVSTARRTSTTPRKFHRLAKRLHDTIASVKKVNHTSSISSWAAAMHMLEKVNKVGFGRMKRVLRWYCREYPQRHRERFFPKVDSGRAFREKFEKLEDAIERDRMDAQESSGQERTPCEQPIDVRSQMIDETPANFDYEKFRRENQLD